MQHLSKVSFYIVACWCVAVGLFNQTISSAEDLPWVADALAGSNLDAFNPILAIWAHWIGMFLVTAGVSLFIILRVLPTTHNTVLIAGVLSIGTVGAQSFSVLSLGAYGPISYVLYCVPLVALIATATGFLGLKKQSASDA